jgi:hypothetical protein
VLRYGSCKASSEAVGAPLAGWQSLSNTSRRVAKVASTSALDIRVTTADRYCEAHRYLRSQPTTAMRRLESRRAGLRAPMQSPRRRRKRRLPCVGKQRSEMGDYVPLAPGVPPIGENRIAEQNHMITLAHRAGGCAVDRISFAFGYVFRPMGGGVGMPGVFVRDDSGHDGDRRTY